MIGALVPYVSKIRRSYQSNDLIDRLSYQYTAIMVVIAAITVVAIQTGKPIQCWVPAQFTGAWERYAETYCFISGSYFLPNDEEFEDDFIKRDEKVIGYYQWVPLVLFFQAFLFYFPSIVWKAFNFSSGINVKAVLNSAAGVKKKIAAPVREVQVKAAANHIREAIEMQHELKTPSLNVIRTFRRSGRYLIALYIFTKVLYVLNVFVQFAILNAFLGATAQSTFWGYEIFMEIMNGQSWKESGHFPRVTMCDFTVRVMGNLHRWTVQCVLMINMFNEKIYIFMWFWFILVGVLSVLSLIYWLIALFTTGHQRRFIAKYLRVTGAISKQSSRAEDDQITHFVNDFLTADGVFLLRLIQLNGGDLLTGEIASALYLKYRERYEKPSLGESPDSSATLPR